MFGFRKKAIVQYQKEKQWKIAVLERVVGLKIQDEAGR